MHAAHPAKRRPPAPLRPTPLPPPGGRGYWLAVALLAVLALGGLAALAGMLLGGPAPRSRWAYAAATLAFLLAAAQAAPVLALVSRLGKGYWGVPLHRAAELLGLAGLVTTPLALLLLSQLPPADPKHSIWFGWPGAPLLWDGLAFAMLAALGLALVWLTGLPDRTLAGGAAWPGQRGWRGSTRQWRLLASAMALLGTLYAIVYVLVSLVVASDFGLSLVPGWRSAVLPATLGVSGLQAGLAVTVLAAAALRRVGRWREAVEPGTFQAAGKLLLAFALLWFYFWWSEFLTYWYGRTPEERWLLGLFMFGPYLGPFLGAFLLAFLLPTALLVWNPIRNSVAGVAIAAGLTLAGLLFDRVRLFVAAWSEPPAGLGHGEQAPAPQRVPPAPAEIPSLPAPLWPDPLDLLIVVGALAAVGLLCLLALRLLPPISLWERRWAERLVVERRVLAAEVEVVARPS